VTGRVVLCDTWGEIADVAAPLAGLDVTVELQQRVTPGPGIVALLAGPDTRVDAALLAALPDLRIVAATSTGFDHLDVDAIARAGVWATHVAGYCDGEVADHTIAFVIDLLRGVTLLDRSVRSGAWDYAVAQPVRIAGATLGIVGFGRIGRAVAARAVALGMRVGAYDPVLTATTVAEHSVVVHPTLAGLLATSDVVSLHAPLSDATRGLIDADALRVMRPGAFLVNCARAALVDDAALGDALVRGQLGGCALDVLPTEPPGRDEPALTWPRTIINPHAAWASPAAIREPYRRAAIGVAALLRGDEPADVVARPAAS